MHELSIALSIAELSQSAANGRRIKRINVEIGALAGVMPDSLAFGFEIVVEGTSAEGAQLNIIPIAAIARCDDCGVEFAIEEHYQACACGSFRKTLLKGGELSIRSLELEPEAA